MCSAGAAAGVSGSGASYQKSSCVARAMAWRQRWICEEGSLRRLGEYAEVVVQPSHPHLLPCSSNILASCRITGRRPSSVGWGSGGRCSADAPPRRSGHVRSWLFHAVHR